MFRSCNPQHGYSTNCVLLRVLQTSVCVFLPETLHTFLALLYRQFRDKNSAIVAASRWFSDATPLEDTARTSVTKILDKPRYTSRRECAAHFNAHQHPRRIFHLQPDGSYMSLCYITAYEHDGLSRIHVVLIQVSRITSEVTQTDETVMEQGFWGCYTSQHLHSLFTKAASHL
jgi:hypothetical protein